MKSLDFQTLAHEPLPENEQANVRLDLICDELAYLLDHAHGLANEIDPDLADYFHKRMSRALRAQR